MAHFDYFCFLFVFIFISILSLLPESGLAAPIKNATLRSSSIDPEYDNLLPLLSSTLEYTFEFLGQLTTTQTGEMYSILHDKHLTKLEIREKLTKWSTRQDDSIRTKFKKYIDASDELKQQVLAEVLRRSAHLSQDAFVVFKKYKKTYDNDALTPDQECQKLGRITSKVEITTPLIANELRTEFGTLPTCSYGSIRFPLFPKIRQKLSRHMSDQSIDHQLNLP